MTSLLEPMQRRRHELGIPYAELAARAGVSVSTAKRVLSGSMGRASMEHVVALLRAMGMSLTVSADVSSVAFREEAARQQADRLARMVEGTSALEAQEVDATTAADLRRESVHRLMAGPPRRVWAR